MGVKGSLLSDRLARLIAEGKRPVTGPAEHVKELKGLVEKRVDERSIRRGSKVFKALSDPSRLRIIQLVSTRDLCVCEIMAALDLTQPTASHHLGILEDAGMLRVKRDGKWTFYGVADPDTAHLIERIIKRKD